MAFDYSHRTIISDGRLRVDPYELAIMHNRRDRRRLAELQQRDRRTIELTGERVTARVVSALNAEMLNELERGRDPSQAVRDRLEREWTPVVQRAMVAANLTGRVRSGRMAAVKLRESRTMAAYDDALEWLAKRLALSNEQVQRLIDLYGNEAALVTREASAAIEDAVQRVMQRIVKRGLHVKDAIAELRRALQATGSGPMSPALMTTLVRSQVQLSYGAGRWTAAQDPAIQEILWGFEYTTVGDDRVRPSHEALDGARLPKNDPRWSEIFPPNGFQCRCYLPGTLVRGMFIAGSKALYSGPAVELETASGRRLSVTANHPVLTGDRWIPASEINEGDDLFCYSADVGGLAASQVDDEQAPSRIEDVFDSFASQTAISTNASVLDFHGDGRFVSGEIDIVAADVMLTKQLQSKLLGSRRDFRLVLSDLAGSFRPCPAHLSDDSVTSASLDTLPLLSLLRRSRTKFEAGAYEQSIHNTTRDAKVLGNRIDRAPSAIFSDNPSDVPSLRGLTMEHSSTDTPPAQESNHGTDINPKPLGNRGGVVGTPIFAQDVLLVGHQYRLCGFTDAEWDLFPAKEVKDRGQAHVEFIRNLLEASSIFIPALDEGFVQPSGDRGSRRLSVTSDGNAVPLKESPDNAVACAELPAEPLARTAGKIAPDKVIRVRHFKYSGHVYDLQSTKGWMLANDIIASNCTTIELFTGDSDAEQKDPPGTVETPEGQTVRVGADVGWQWNPGEVIAEV